MNWILLVTAIIVSMFIPFLVHLLMTFGNAVTENDWIGFFGNYFGALIGIIAAIVISRIQVNGAKEDLKTQLKEQELQTKKRIENETMIQKIENRVFLDYTMFMDKLLLDDRDVHNNKILLHSNIYRFINHNPNDYLKDQLAHFLKVEYFGATESVLDVKILIHIIEANGEETLNVMNRSGLNKNENLYIPLYLHDNRGSLTRVEIEYTTLTQERIRFVSDMLSRKEFYTLIEDSFEHVFYKRELINERYILPGNPGHNR